MKKRTTSKRKFMISPYLMTMSLIVIVVDLGAYLYLASNIVSDMLRGMTGVPFSEIAATGAFFALVFFTSLILVLINPVLDLLQQRADSKKTLASGESNPFSRETVRILYSKQVYEVLLYYAPKEHIKLFTNLSSAIRLYRLE